MTISASTGDVAAALDRKLAHVLEPRMRRALERLRGALARSSTT